MAAAISCAAGRRPRGWPARDTRAARRPPRRTPAPRFVAPYQGPLAQIIQRDQHGLLVSALADQRDQLGDRHGGDLGMQHQQRVEHRQPQEVQFVGGSLDRLAGIGPRGQGRDAAGCGLGEVRP